jgi:hypothetical protein
VSDLEQHPGQPSTTASSLSATAQVNYPNRVFERHNLGGHGYAGMSMEGVAAADGTTAPGLRRMFCDKLELAVARHRRHAD